MNKTEDEVVGLTAECLTRYWKRDSTFIFSHCAPKIVWISARQDEYLLTLDEVRENLETNCAAIPLCHLQHAEFQVAASCSELYVITGKYLVTTDPEEKFFFVCTAALYVCVGEKQQRTADQSYPYFQSHR